MKSPRDLLLQRHARAIPELDRRSLAVLADLTSGIDAVPDEPWRRAWRGEVKLRTGDFAGAVADCDATAAKAKSLGAQVIVEPQDIPNVGRFATFIDPQGAMLAVMKPTRHQNQAKPQKRTT